MNTLANVVSVANGTENRATLRVTLVYLWRASRWQMVSTGLAYDLFGFYGASPDGTNWRRQGAAFLTFEHRINRGLSLRVAANHSQAQLESHVIATGWDT